MTSTAARCDHIVAVIDACLAELLAAEHGAELAQYPEPPWPDGAPEGASRP